MTYSVMLCNKALPTDILVQLCRDREDARQLCRALNAEAMQGWAEGQPQPPLYYVHYAEHAKAELRRLRTEKRICEICATEFIPRMRRQVACGPRCSSIRMKRLSAELNAKKRETVKVGGE